MKRSLLLVFLVGVWISAIAQKPAAPAHKMAVRTAAQERPTQEQVLKLLDLLQVRDSMQVSVDAMKEQVRGTAEQGFREKFPHPTAEQLKAVQGVVDGVFKELALDDLIRDVVPVYQRHLSRSDVKAIIAFYSSPAGRKILHEQPAMIRESMQATAAGQQKKMELLLVKLDLRMEHLIQSEQNKAASPQK